jgi:MauM/NapG family ferredoxin protein
LTGKGRRRLRRATQSAFLLAFLGLQLTATSGSRQLGWADAFFRLDPLIAITATLAGRALVVGLILSLFTLALTLFLGRVWCGWICPLGTLLEWFGPGRRHSRAPRPPERWRGVKILLLVTTVLAALLANQSLLLLDPLTIAARTWSGAVLPAVRYGVNHLEGFFYQFDFLWPALDWLHQRLVFPLLGDLQPVSRLALPFALLFLLLVGANWWAERFWCRYLCPLGGLLGLVARFALVRRHVADDCSQCARCRSDCPTGTIDPARGFQSDPAECIVCLQCVDTCRRGDVSFRWQRRGWHPAARQHYDPSRRQTLLAIGVTVAGVALAGTEPARERPPSRLIRPPGATRTAFESLCIRCNECVRACPTQGLQPTLAEGGWQNLLTPALIPRLGYCSFSCIACGQVCPTGALPPLPLEQKRETPIGLARIDQGRCLPWAYGTPCIVCEETCPVAEKAIELETVEVINEWGHAVVLQRPKVIKARCIGCGICEFQCPLAGDAAIQVHALAGADADFGGAHTTR